MNSMVPVFMTAFSGMGGTGGTPVLHPFPLTLLVPAGQSDALFEYVDRDAGFVLAEYQGRRDANRPRATTQKQDAAFERQLDDAVALLRSVLFRLLVLDDLD